MKIKWSKKWITMNKKNLKKIKGGPQIMRGQPNKVMSI